MIQFVGDDPAKAERFTLLAEVSDHQSQFGSIPFINTANVLGVHEDRPFLDQLQHTFLIGLCIHSALPISAKPSE